MKHKIYIAAVMLASVLTAAAQDTYESARLLGSDLNGTARYVGMGGAMDALGADLSTINSNPAGIGLFRHSSVSASFGFVSQNGAEEFNGLSTTNMSFDQAGFVYTTRINRSSFINFAFNYHKSRNFDQILSAANSLSGCSQNALTYEKAAQGFYEIDVNDKGKAMGYDGYERSYAFSESDYLNANVLMCDFEAYEDPEAAWVFYNDADSYLFDRAHRGWISNFDFNLSGNLNDRVYWGITVGLKNVNYKGFSEYAEGLVGNNGPCGSVGYEDRRKIEGTGLDLTGGIIFRPVEDSPFRIGLSISTPTWYDLSTTNETIMLNDSDYGAMDEEYTSSSYDFKYYTPWRFGLSLGHTVGTQLAIGAGYEYSDYSSAKNRINKDDPWYDSWYDDYDYGYSPSYNDEAMEENADYSLKGVHTLKAGLEFKPLPELSLRAGFNYLTSTYDMKGERDMMLYSPGVSYSSTTDYVNWKATHRYTCGIGYKVGGMNLDLAYQYSQTRGDFHPFQPIGGDSGVAPVANKRHQVLLTMGYTF